MGDYIEVKKRDTLTSTNNYELFIHIVAFSLYCFNF